MASDNSKILITSTNNNSSEMINQNNIFTEKESIMVCETCINSTCKHQDHFKISIRDLLAEYRSNSNSIIDYSIVEKYLKKIEENNPITVREKLNNLKIKSINILNKKLTNFQNKFHKRLNEIREKIEQNYLTIENNFFEAESRIQSNNIEVLNNISIDEIISFFEKGSRSEKELENMINLVKKNSDQDKIKRNLQDMEAILFSKMLSNQQSSENVEIKEDDFNKELVGLTEDLSREIDVEMSTPSVFKLNKDKFNSNPKNFIYKKDITDKLQKSYTIDSVFCAFTTFDGKCYIAWGCPTFTVEVYDLIQDKLVKSLTGFSQHIYITRHFFDKIPKKDYLLSTSYSKICKVWDCQNFSNIVTIKNCHTGAYLYSGLIIFDSSFVSSPLVLTVAPNENIKVWDFEGVLVNQINTSTDYTYYLNVWYDDRDEKCNIYIINANSKDVKIYDYKTGKVYKTFYNVELQAAWHMSALVENIKNKPYLFESDGQGNLRVWDIETQTIYKKILVDGINLRGICFWNEQFVLVAGTDKTVKVIDYMKEKLEGTIEANNNILCTVDKIRHPILGECIFSGGIDGKIKMFTQA